MRLALGVLVSIALGSGTAMAYPEFQFSTGTSRCGECHFAPVGGGLINAYGRDEAASTISGSGDGRFLHGAIELPEWIAIGGDVRGAAFGRRVRDGVEGAVFPMQAELYVRAASGGLSVMATAGYLDALRDRTPLTDRLGSREHYVMYETESKEWYARAGRFLPAFGLRMPDHTAYVRRYTGLHTLEESYGASAGYIGDAWEVHATALTPLTLHATAGQHGWGGAVHVEKQTGEATGAFSAQAKVMRIDGAIDAWLGATWKKWLADSDLWFAAEVDVGVVQLDDVPDVRRVVAYGAVHYRPGKTWGAAFGAHAFDGDLRLADNERVALETRFAWFPRAHFEIAALIRGAVLAREFDRGDLLGFLQLHYYL